jgi:hypothetical protein
MCSLKMNEGVDVGWHAWSVPLQGILPQGKI